MCRHVPVRIPEKEWKCPHLLINRGSFIAICSVLFNNCFIPVLISREKITLTVFKGKLRLSDIYLELLYVSKSVLFPSSKYRVTFISRDFSFLVMTGGPYSGQINESVAKAYFFPLGCHTTDPASFAAICRLLVIHFLRGCSHRNHLSRLG